MSSYKILGVSLDNGEFSSVELHESDNIERANSWIVGYIRSDNYGGYDSINVVSANGFTKSIYSKDFGWSHY
tara:strand:+ start:461 stop:676 length:216 start_codon:yes stop_codon:yes gene_type:complete